jgi:hypothetical protein
MSLPTCGTEPRGRAACEERIYVEESCATEASVITGMWVGALNMRYEPDVCTDI